VVRDGDGQLVYRFTLPCDPVADPDYLAALVAGQRVAAIACERAGTAQVFYAKSLGELREWAARVRGGDGTTVTSASPLCDVHATARGGPAGCFTSPRAIQGWHGRCSAARHTGQPATQAE
jgi:hypothetical protein